MKVNNLREIKGILFDCDGVILDTDRTYRLLVSKLLTEEFNYPITHEECIERWRGKNADQIARELFFEGVDFADEFVSEIHKLSEQYFVDESLIIPNLIHVLENVKLPKAICSNGRTVRIISNLKDVNIDSYFDHVLGRDILGVMKPDPKVYLKGAEAINVDIEHCLVVEDSATGLRAGIEAGAVTVAFTGSGGDVKELTSLNPDYIIHDMSQLLEIINQNNKGK